MILLMFLVFITLLIFGIPIIFSLGIAALSYLATRPMLLVVVPQRLVSSFENFVFVAIPLFMLAGEIMNTGGITRRLVNLSKVFVGRLKGGLAYVNVVASMFFGGIQGLATADTAAIGSVLIPAMKKTNYSPDFSTAITVASATIGAIIPPSVLMIIFGMVTGISIGKLFLGGLVPGIIIGLAQMVYVYIYGRFQGYRGRFPPGESVPLAKSLKYLREGIPAMVLPAIIIVGITTGVFTPTESAGIAVLYALGFSLITGEMKIDDIPKVLFRTAKMAGSVMLILGTASIFAWILTVEKIPHQLANLLVAISSNRYIILLLLNVLLLIIGTFMDPTPSAIILGPILVPLLQDMGMDPIHIGVFMCFNLILGHTTPPVGTCLYIASGISGLSIEAIGRSMIPILAVNFVTLMLITYLPELVLFLPNLFM
jgi:tripartite ATP-independent transporter DctM subunit